MTILTGIFIFLWSLLLIIPGIIAAYRYRMALYLLLDNPNMSVYQCIRESKRMMVGHKAELFVLDLSFLGWYILSAVPFVSIWVTPIRRLPMPFITMHFAQILVTPDLWAPPHPVATTAQANKVKSCGECIRRRIYSIFRRKSLWLWSEFHPRYKPHGRK